MSGIRSFWYLWTSSISWPQFLLLQYDRDMTATTTSHPEIPRSIDFFVHYFSSEVQNELE